LRPTDRRRAAKLQVALVQRGVWDMDRQSMPLAAGYLKAVADADPDVGAAVATRVFNFGGGESVLKMARRLFFDQPPPDAVGFSVLGWNFNDFGRLAQLYRSLRPDGWIIFGGNHVSDQAARVFAVFPEVDVVVNGEGELTFLELCRAMSIGRSPRDLAGIDGLSYKTDDGEIATTPARERIVDLEIIPSPILTGTLPLVGRDGAFLYDAVLMETNRGCPYKCAFCYWGGAIGQKLRRFAGERIAAELDVCGYYGVPDVVLCDANFGMLREDFEFVETLIRTREKYGYPRGFETSWAKNKGSIFYRIVKRMKDTGFRSSFTLALQTLSAPALELMGRKNMKLNEWRELAAWLRAQGLDCYAELIWGVPGETVESFIDGYDQLAGYVSRIAVYPHLIMPNTDFSRQRAEHGFVLVRGGKDDFEYVIAHRTLSIEDNQRMHKFLFWARVIAENQVLRWIWIPLRELVGVSQSAVLLSMDRWFEANVDDPVAQGLIACRSEMVDNLDASRVTGGIHYCYRESGMESRMSAWWRQEIMPLVPGEYGDFFLELLRYDLATRPVLGHDAELERAVHGVDTYYVRRQVSFRYDIPSAVHSIAEGLRAPIPPSPQVVDLYYRAGFATHIDNHEFVLRYVGKTAGQLQAELRLAEEATLRVTSTRRS
jgi:radical SAM superfamily enzyme YgiQ (UPF0313 family)